MQLEKRLQEIINDAKKEIHKIVLKASNENKQSSTIEFFVKVHENPKIKN